jgi:hypothetical protein
MGIRALRSFRQRIVALQGIPTDPSVRRIDSLDESPRETMIHEQRLGEAGVPREEHLSGIRYWHGRSERRHTSVADRDARSAA